MRKGTIMAKAKAKAVKAVEVEGLTEAQILAAQRILAERAKAARVNADKPGLHAVPLAPADPGNNVVAKCRYNVPNVGTVWGTAKMNDADGTAKYIINPSRSAWSAGISVVGGEAGDLAARVALVAEHAPEIEAYLRKEYARLAKSHTFVVKKRDEE